MKKRFIEDIKFYNRAYKLGTINKAKLKYYRQKTVYRLIQELWGNERN